MRHAVLCLLLPLSASAATCAMPTLQGDGCERNTPEASGMNTTALFRPRHAA